MPVTTRIITFLIGNPYKPSFVTVTGWGVDPTHIPQLHQCIIANFRAFQHSCFFCRNLSLVLQTKYPKENRDFCHFPCHHTSPPSQVNLPPPFFDGNPTAGFVAPSLLRGSCSSLVWARSNPVNHQWS